MQNQPQELEAELQGLPDEALVRIALAKPDEYRSEAIACARSVLQRRGRDISDPQFVRAALAVPTYEEQLQDEDERDYCDTLSNAAYPWPSWVLMLFGGLVCLAIWRGFEFQQASMGVYLVTVGALFCAVAQYEVVRTWGQRSFRTQFQAITVITAAAFLLVLSFLLLTGVVHY